MKSYLTIFLLTASIITFAQEKTVNTISLGAPAPDFNLPGVDGKKYTLTDFKDSKLLAVIFTCNHCPTAQAYEDRMIKMVEQYQDQGVAFVGISPNDPEAISLSELGYSDLNDDLPDMKIRAKDKGYNFPYLYDGETQEASIAYGPVATPHVFVFDEDRKLRYSGRIDDTEDPYVPPRRTDLVDALEQLISGKEVAVPQTKTFGCSVKWAWKDAWTKKLKEQWAEEPVSLVEKNLEEIKTIVANSSDKLRLINLWATWCGPCLIEFPELVSINRMYRDRDFEFISISTDKLGKKEKAHEILTKKEASNVNFIFSGKDIYQLIEVIDPNWKGSLPYTLLVASGGEYIYAREGIIDPLELRKTIVNHIGRYYADN